MTFKSQKYPAQKIEIELASMFSWTVSILNSDFADAITLLANTQAIAILHAGFCMNQSPGCPPPRGVATIASWSLAGAAILKIDNVFLTVKVP